MSWLLAAHRDPYTYRTAAHLLAGLPLGIIGFTLVVTGLSLGIGLAVTLLGIPVLVATFLGVRALAGFERDLARTLLGAPMPRIMPAETSHGVFWQRMRSLVTDRRIWFETTFLVIRLPLGIVGFVFVATVLALAVSGVVMPILVATGVDPELGTTSIDTFAESLIYLPLSVVFLLAGPRMILGWGELTGRVVTAMLGRLEPAELKMAVAEVLKRDEDTDAFRILGELERRFGRGRFLTPTKVEATLLALESNGRIEAHRTHARIRYALAGNGAR